MQFTISLRAARVNREMTQEKVAEILHVSKATVIAWEKGKWKIPETTLRALADLYRVPVEMIRLKRRKAS